MHFRKTIFQMFIVSHISPGRENNMCTFISICQMFTISHIFSCRGKQYVHFYSNISYVCCLTHVPVSGSIMSALLHANIVNIYCWDICPCQGR